MMTLRDLQTRFVGALFDGTADALGADIVANGVSIAERVDIYRNNLQEGFIKALTIGFPVIERLVGTDYFRQLARDFHRQHPSQSGNLDYIGGPFPGFLSARFAGTEYEYLTDVASLEWAHQQALIAAEAMPLDAKAFQGITPEQFEQLRFDLHPACSLVRSKYPIVRIWHANQPEAVDDGVIDLRSGGEDLVVLRTADGVEFHRVPGADFALLEAISRGGTLGEALEAAQALEPAFDLGDTLRRILTLPILVRVHAPAAST